jgi:serine/threonine protein kinase
LFVVLWIFDVATFSSSFSSFFFLSHLLYILLCSSAEDKNGPKGTFLWMAPEVINEEEFDHSLDVYSFGLILLEAWCGTGCELVIGCCFCCSFVCLFLSLVGFLFGLFGCLFSFCFIFVFIFFASFSSLLMHRQAWRVCLVSVIFVSLPSSDRLGPVRSRLASMTTTTLSSRPL